MRTLLAVTTLLFSTVPLAVRAEGIYRYEEKDGTIIYTNVPPAGAKRARKLKGTFRAAPPPSGSVPSARRVSDEDINAAIRSASQRYRIPESLVRAVMHAESNYDANAVSHVGASGLMQLMPQTAQEMYVKDIFDVRENIEGGTRYLRVLANLYSGDMVKMVAAYNAGPDAVKKYGGNIPPYAETQAYVRKVLKLYYQYKEQLAREEASAEADAPAPAQL
ncbi:MAG: lytic transglycosylase domain-containing protein [Myxococcaceae bacterium]|nr:lytic transglycosylase domain-containing protein [Myxococcaceae bacterium]MCI0672708.1 lytic transglycosylase domain-containing protein [Myxococcaceae bacterium]